MGFLIRNMQYSPKVVMKTVGPRLVPFFKTFALYFVIFPKDSVTSFWYCLFKCLPIISLMIFVLMHGINFSEAYSYSRRILIGLIFSCIGDACLVWSRSGYFIHGVFFFALAHVMYVTAFGFNPLKIRMGMFLGFIALSIFLVVTPNLELFMIPIVFCYCFVIYLMVWRSLARFDLLDDAWKWTHLCSSIGAIVFAISDTLLAIDHFIYPFPYSQTCIMFTYYAAQLGIALSVVDSQVDKVLEISNTQSKNKAI